VSTCQIWDAFIWKLLQTYQNLENALLKWFSKVTHLVWSSSRIKQSDGVLFIIFLICFIYDFLPEFRPCRLVSFLMYWKISVKNRQFPHLTNNSCTHWGWSCLIIMLIGNDTWAIKWSRDQWRYVSFKGQTRDPNTLRAQYLENGWI